jgi:hypothetical protein
MGELSKIVTRAGLVKAFAADADMDGRGIAKILTESDDGPQTRAELAADRLLLLLRRTHGLATLGSPGGVGGRPVPPGLIPDGYEVRQPEVVDMPLDDPQ